MLGGQVSRLGDDQPGHPARFARRFGAARRAGHGQIAVTAIVGAAVEAQVRLAGGGNESEERLRDLARLCVEVIEARRVDHDRVVLR